MNFMVIAVLRLAAPAGEAAPVCQTIRFPASPAAVSAQCASVSARVAERLDALLSIPEASRTFANTAVELDRILVDLEEDAAPLTVLRHVSPSLPVRIASGDCYADIAKLSVEIMSREDLYRAVDAFSGERGPADHEDLRLIEELKDQFKRNGVLLSPEDRARLRVLKKALVEDEREFNRNHVESNDWAPFEKAELDGVPAGVLRQFSRLPDGRVKVPADRAAFDALESSCRNPEIRRGLEFLHNNRTYPDNLAIEEEVFSLRRRMARLLGYSSYAQFMLERRMAGSPENVRSFAERVRRKSAPKAQEHVRALLALKREDEPGAAAVHLWDVRYYESVLGKRLGMPEAEAVAEYFPLSRVVDATMDEAGKTFGLRFKEVKPARAWHPDVRQFEAFDRESGSLLGRFYLDLLYREGKVKSNPNFPLMGRRSGAAEPCRMAATVFVMSLRKPGEGPVLLKHANLGSFLHGFGHLLHQLLSTPRHARYSGGRVAEDFEDVPAKVLENWAWDKEVLRRLSGRLQDGRPIPDEMLDALLRSRGAFASLGYLSWAVQTVFDLEVHSRDVADVNALNQRLFDEFSPVPQTPGTHPELKYSIVKGGGVGLYIYRWSEAIAMDILERFKPKGLLDPATGMEYRRLILEPGGSVEPREMLKAFLGREPSEDALIKILE